MPPTKRKHEEITPDGKASEEKQSFVKDSRSSSPKDVMKLYSGPGISAFRPYKRNERNAYKSIAPSSP